MPAGIDTGVRAKVIVLPDTSRFVPSLEKYIKRIEHSLKIEIPTTVDPSGIDEKLAQVRQKQQRNPVTVPVTAKADEFTRQVHAQVQKAVRTAQANIPLTADGEALRRDLDAQVAALERMTKLTVPLDLGMAARFRADVLAQVEEIERLAQSAAPKVDIAADVESITPAVIAEAEKATRAAPTVRIKTAIDRSAASAVSAMTTITGQLSTTAASVGANLLLWGPPILAALAGLVAMAPALAILAPFAVGFGLAIGAVALSLDRLKKTFKPLGKAIEDLKAPVGRALTKGLAPIVSTLAEKLIPALKVGLTGVAKVMNESVRAVLGFTASKQGIALITSLFNGLASALRPMTAALGPLTKAFLQIGVAALPGLKAFSQGLADVSIKFANFINRASKSGDLTRTISGAIGGTGKLLSGLGNFLGPLIKGLAAIGPSVLSGIGAGFSALGTAITFIIAKVRELQPTFAAIGVSLAPFVAVFQAAFAVVMAQVGFFIATIQQIAPALQPFLGLLTAVAATIAANIGPAFAFLRAALAPVVAGFISFLSVIGPQLLPTFAALKAFIAGLIPTITSFATSFTAVLGPGLARIGAVIANDLLPAFRAILPVVQPVVAFLLKMLGSSVVLALKGAINIITGLLKVIAGIFNVFAGIFTGDWKKAWNGIKQIFSGAFTAIVGLVQVFLAGGILKLFRVGMTGLVSLVKGAGPKLLSSGRAIMTSLRSGVSSGFATVRSFVAGIPGKVVSALGNVGSLLYNAGTQLVQGMINGLRAAVGGLISAAASMAGDAVNAVKSKLHIKSPSRVMIQLGRYVSQGFAEGILGDSDKVRDAATTLTQKITDAVASYAKAKTSIGDKIKADTEALKKAQAKYSQTVKEHAASASSSVRNAGQALKRAQAKYAADLKSNSTSKTLSAARRAISASKERYANAVSDSGKSAKKAIDAARERVTTALKKLAKDKAAGQALDLSYGAIAKASPSALKAITTLIAKGTAALAKVADQRAAVAETLKDAQSKLDEAIKVRDDYASQIRDANVAYASVIAEPSSSGRLTASQVLKQLQAKVQAVIDFKKNIEALRAQGLSDAALQQLVDAGVQAGSATAAALAKGGQAAIAQVNDLTGTVAQQAGALGTDMAQQFYGAGVNAAQGLVDGLNSQLAALDAIAKQLADSLVSQVKKRLGIKSPSTVMAEVGGNIVAGLARGMDASRAVVERASDRMTTAVMPSPTDFATPGAHGTAGGTSIVVNSYNPAPETNSETVTRSMRRLAVLGLA